MVPIIHQFYKLFLKRGGGEFMCAKAEQSSGLAWSRVAMLKKVPEGEGQV